MLAVDGLQLPRGFVGNNTNLLVGNGMVLVSPHARLDHKRLAQGSRNEHEEHEEGAFHFRELDQVSQLRGCTTAMAFPLFDAPFFLEVVEVKVL